MKENIKVLMLTGGKESTNIVFNALSKTFNIDTVVVEQPVSKKKFIKRRIKKLGLYTVFGQVLFQFVISKFLKRTSNGRIKEIFNQYNLDVSPISSNRIFNVSSINSKETIEFLKKSDADVILVNGTRIISKKVLEVIKIPIINTHVGITPLYRGVHGGYWALVNNDRKNCGVTVHLIDAGIDTGSILGQSLIEVTPKDNFMTYPLIQLGAALPLLERIIKGYKNLKHIPSPVGKSKLWSHPTIFEYLYYRIFKNVK